MAFVFVDCEWGPVLLSIYYPGFNKWQRFGKFCQNVGAGPIITKLSLYVYITTFLTISSYTGNAYKVVGITAELILN